MQVSFALPDVLRLFRHLRGNPALGILAHPDLRVSAVDGHLCLENPQLAVAVEAVVLEAGAFTISRRHLHTLLRGFPDRKTLLLEADPDHLVLGPLRLAMSVRDFNPHPALPAFFDRTRYIAQTVPSPVFSAGAFTVSFGETKR